jgi:hypothetical protein
MNKRIVILAFLLVVFLFTGCVKITYYQQIHPDKSSDQQLEIDFSNLYQMQKSFNESMSLADFDEMLNKGYCQSIINNLTKYEAMRGVSFTCSAKDAKVIIKGRSKETYGLIKEETIFENIYTYSFNLSNASGESAGLTSLMGIQIKLIVEMPGEIVETNGKVEGKNKVVFDLVELASKNETPYVKAKETKLDMVVAAVVAILIIVGVIVFLIRKRQQQ